MLFDVRFCPKTCGTYRKRESETERRKAKKAAFFTLKMDSSAYYPFTILMQHVYNIDIYFSQFLNMSYSKMSVNMADCKRCSTVGESKALDGNRKKR